MCISIGSIQFQKNRCENVRLFFKSMVKRQWNGMTFSCECNLKYLYAKNFHCKVFKKMQKFGSTNAEKEIQLMECQQLEIMGIFWPAFFDGTNKTYQ